jgi:hypothetical protein
LTRKFAQPGGASEELEEGKREGRRGLYRGQNLEEGVGFLWRIDRWLGAYRVGAGLLAGSCGRL